MCSQSTHYSSKSPAAEKFPTDLPCFGKLSPDLDVPSLAEKSSPDQAGLSDLNHSHSPLGSSIYRTEPIAKFSTADPYSGFLHFNTHPVIFNTSPHISSIQRDSQLLHTVPRKDSNKLDGTITCCKELAVDQSPSRSTGQHQISQRMCFLSHQNVHSIQHPRMPFQNSLQGRYNPLGVESCSVSPDMYCGLRFPKAQILKCSWVIRYQGMQSGILCDQRFGCMEDLVEHVCDLHVFNQGRDRHICRWQGCTRNGIPFKERYRLINHLRVHTGERPFPCVYPGCRKRFARLENMKIHRRIHTGEKPFPCDFPGCQRRFGNASDRKKHSYVHSSDKPYLCCVTGCKNRFADPGSLRKHMMVHERAAVLCS